MANARVLALGGSAVAGLATYVLMRLPMPTAGEAVLRGALVFLGCAALALLAPLTTLLWFFPSLRHRTWFYLLQTITLAGLPPTVGAGAGFLAAVDDDVAAHRQGKEVVTALEAHRAAHGELPDSLDALVPARLPAAPTTGPWPLRVAFRYRRLTKETFELSFTSPSGPRYFAPSLDRFVAVPWTGPPPGVHTSRVSSSASPSAAPPTLEPSADDPLPLPALLTHGAWRRAARGACSARARGRAARSGFARRWRAREDRGGCSA